MKLKIGLLLLIVGGGTWAYGWSEGRVSEGTNEQAAAADLAKLEAGGKPDNNHITIGGHTACYYASVYSYYTKKKNRGAKATDTTRLSYVFYPIISSNHPFNQELVNLLTKYGSLDKIPDEVDLPQIDQFVVLVKTKRFGTLKDIPNDPLRKETGIQGLVINVVSPLSSKEKDLIRDSFPKIDFNKVLILEEGRTPTSAFWSSSLIFGGIAVLLGGLALLGLGIIGWFTGLVKS